MYCKVARLASHKRGNGWTCTGIITDIQCRHLNIIIRTLNSWQKRSLSKMIHPQYRTDSVVVDAAAPTRRPLDASFAFRYLPRNLHVARTAA
jgi:hypothetical protein